MRFLVPKFIEHEAKIVGPLTIRQFFFIGIGGAACIALFFLAPIYLFLLGLFIFMGPTTALAFVKIQGRSLPDTIINFLFFSAKPRIYIWRKGGFTPRILKTTTILGKETEEPLAAPPRVGGESQIRKLSTYVETKSD